VGYLVVQGCPRGGKGDARLQAGGATGGVSAEAEGEGRARRHEGEGEGGGSSCPCRSSPATKSMSHRTRRILLYPLARPSAYSLTVQQSKSRSRTPSRPPPPPSLPPSNQSESPMPALTNQLIHSPQRCTRGGEGEERRDRFVSRLGQTISCRRRRRRTSSSFPLSSPPSRFHTHTTQLHSIPFHYSIPLPFLSQFYSIVPTYILSTT
jgi:hypothetical protein